MNDILTKEEIVKLKELLKNSEYAHTQIDAFYNPDDPWKFRDFSRIYAILNGIRDEIPKILQEIEMLKNSIQHLKK